MTDRKKKMRTKKAVRQKAKVFLWFHNLRYEISTPELTKDQVPDFLEVVGDELMKLVGKKNVQIAVFCLKENK